MLEVGGGLDLGQETLGPYDCCQFRLEHLERDLPLVLEVIRQVDRRHPALTDLALDTVAALEGGVQASFGVWGVHGG